MSDKLIDQVTTNLVHYNSWTEVKPHSFSSGTILTGFPPSKLDSSDEDNVKEWVVPTSMVSNSELSLSEIDGWFEAIALVESRPKRVTIAMVNDDGTVVYYFIHDGVVKPRQN